LNSIPAVLERVALAMRRITDLPLVKWKDWQSDDAYGSGHIFFEKPN